MQSHNCHNSKLTGDLTVDKVSITDDKEKFVTFANDILPQDARMIDPDEVEDAVTET